LLVLGDSLAKLREPGDRAEILRLVMRGDQVLVDVAGELVLFEPDLERVPLAGPVVLRGDLLEDLPAKHVGPLEASEGELGAGGVEAVVPIAAVAAEDEPRRPGFVVELDGDGELVGQCGNLALPHTQRAAAEAGASPVGDDPAGALAPAGAIGGLPLGLV